MKGKAMAPVKRVTLYVRVDLDPTPGAFHDVESARQNIEHALRGVIPHYDPKVYANRTQD